jgi:hypothetical protein
MQSYAIVLALVLVAAVQGFAPASQGRVGSKLNESLFDKVANMDLFAPKKDQNTYGARAKKNVSTRTNSKNSVLTATSERLHERHPRWLLMIIGNDNDNGSFHSSYLLLSYVFYLYTFYS